MIISTKMYLGILWYELVLSRTAWSRTCPIRYCMITYLSHPVLHDHELVPSGTAWSHICPIRYCMITHLSHAVYCMTSCITVLTWFMMCFLIRIITKYTKYSLDYLTYVVPACIIHSHLKHSIPSSHITYGFILLLWIINVSQFNSLECIAFLSAMS